MDKIQPDMEDYGDTHYLKLVKKINEMIDIEDRDFRMILTIRNDLQDIRKDIDELKKAVRNF